MITVIFQIMMRIIIVIVQNILMLLRAVDCLSFINLVDDDDIVVVQHRQCGIDASYCCGMYGNGGVVECDSHCLDEIIPNDGGSKSDGGTAIVMVIIIIVGFELSFPT